MEEKEEEKKVLQKLLKAPKKGKQTFTGDLHIPHCLDELDETLPSRVIVDSTTQDVFADLSRAAHDERK